MSYSTGFPTALLLLIFVDDKIKRSEYEFVPLKLISERLSIPRPTLVKIVRDLMAQQIVESKEGKSGGIRICKETQSIHLLDIFLAIEQKKPVFSNVPTIKATGKRPDQARKSVQEILDDCQLQLEKYLGDITFESLQKKSRSKK